MLERNIWEHLTYGGYPKVVITGDNELKKNISSIRHRNIISYITRSIEHFNLNYKKEQIIKIYNHAFNFDYTTIKKELKDRIIFITKV